MKTRSLRLLALAAAVTTFAPVAPAAAVPAPGVPGAVSIRVEGETATTVAAVRIDTTATPLAVTDGVTAATCSGTSALAALNTATGGAWSGYVDPTYGPSVEIVKGESHTFATGRYWSFWVNGKPADLGACSQEVVPGDAIVFFVGCAGATTGCADGALLSSVPATAKPGGTLSVSVDQASQTFGGPPDFAAVFSQVAASGANVSFSGATATTGADGTASLTVGQTRGPQQIAISKNGFARFSAPICVSDGADGECGSIKPIPGTTTPTPQTIPEPASATGCIPGRKNGLCGTPDLTPPLVQLSGITHGKRYTAKTAPRELRGVVGSFDGGKRTDDPSGLKDVRVRIVRTLGKTCASYDGKSERFERMRECQLGKGKFFSVGTKSQWSYLLPSRLTRGSYTIEANAIDGKGNVLRTRVAEQNFFRFIVR